MGVDTQKITSLFEKNKGGENLNTFEIIVTVVVLIIMIGGFIAGQIAARVTGQDNNPSNEA